MHSRNNRYLSNRSRNNSQPLLNRHFENIALYVAIDAEFTISDTDEPI